MLKTLSEIPRQKLWGDRMVEEYSDEELEEILDRVYGWGAEFSRSKYFEGLTEEQKKESEFVGMSFTEYMYYHGLSSEE